MAPARADQTESNCARLRDYFSALGSVLVAYSGGVDSALLAWLAHDALGVRMRAVLADSASLARRELESARRFALHHGIPLDVVQTSEMDNEKYRRNAGDRCYHCKTALFEKLSALSRQWQTRSPGADWPLCYGVNLDDLGDYRPGLQAAREFKIISPYLDLQLGKQDIRNMARHLALDIAEKPAMPCLASRIPHGDTVDAHKLAQVEQAENMLADMGFVQFRVRHHGDLARIEVPDSDMLRVLELRDAILAQCKKAGFKFIALELAGFKSGSLNATLA